MSGPEQVGPAQQGKVYKSADMAGGSACALPERSFLDSRTLQHGGWCSHHRVAGPSRALSHSATNTYNTHASAPLTVSASQNFAAVIRRAGTVCSDYGGISVGIEGFDDV